MSNIKKIPSFVKNNDWINKKINDIPSQLLSKMRGGWGNGYCGLPPDHPCWGMSYDDIYREYPHIDIESELTFSNKNGKFSDECPEDYWIFGFDTLHFGDDLIKWPEDKVRETANKLAYFFLEIWIKKERDENREI